MRRLDPARRARRVARGHRRSSTSSARLPNEFVELPYADGDVRPWHARPASAPATCPPSFAGVTLTRAGATAHAGPTPAPTPTAGPTSATAGRADAWNWSDRDVTWPVPGTTAAPPTWRRSAGQRGQCCSPPTTCRTPTARRPPGRSPASAGRTCSSRTRRRPHAARHGERPGPRPATRRSRLSRGCSRRPLPPARRRRCSPRPGGPPAATNLDRVLALLRRQSWITVHDRWRPRPGKSAPTAVRLRGNRLPSVRWRRRARSRRGSTRCRSLGKAVTAGAATVTAPQRPRAARRAVGRLAGRTTARGRSRATTMREGVHGGRGSGAGAAGGRDSTSSVADGTAAVTVANGLPVPVRVRIVPGVSNGRLQFRDPSTTVDMPAAESGKPAKLRVPLDHGTATDGRDPRP